MISPNYSRAKQSAKLAYTLLVKPIHHYGYDGMDPEIGFGSSKQFLGIGPEIMVIIRAPVLFLWCKS